MPRYPDTAVNVSRVSTVQFAEFHRVFVKKLSYIFPLYWVWTIQVTFYIKETTTCHWHLSVTSANQHFPVCIFNTWFGLPLGERRSLGRELAAAEPLFCHTWECGDVRLNWSWVNCLSLGWFFWTRRWKKSPIAVPLRINFLTIDDRKFSLVDFSKE